MNIPGPISAQPLDPALRHDLALRPFQRITADVVQVTATQAILSVDGYPIVAQLSSPDQAAILRNQRQAQFVVSQMDDQTILLRFLRPGQTVQAGATTVLPGADAAHPEAARIDLATRLLEQLGQPVNAQNLILARAAMGHRLLISVETFQEMATALDGLGSWGAADADLAAELKAEGLPLSPGSLQLAGRGTEQVGDAMARLIALLQQAAEDPDFPAGLRQALTQSQLLLDDATVDWNTDPGQIAARLKTAVDLLGRSLENVLKDQVQEQSPFWPEKSLVQLARLQEQFRQAGKPELAEVITRFLDDARMNHLANAHNELQPGREGWTQIGFALRPPQRGPDPETYPARLRVARQGGANKGSIDPAYTRLMIQVDLEGGETMQVDLSLVGRSIRAAVTTPDAELCARAREEMPTFEEALRGLGYALKDAQVGVGSPPPFEGAAGHAPTRGSDLLAVDLEV